LNAIKLCEAELEALQELVLDGYPFAHIMYVLQFRPRMSFDSFTVGDKANNTVKESWLGDCIERQVRQGSRFPAKRRSRDFIQRQIKMLCKYGLLKRLKKEHQRSPMCFFFPLACAGLNRSQEVRTMSAQTQTHNTSLCEPHKENPVNSTADVVRTSVDNFEGTHNEKKAKCAHIPVNRNLLHSNNILGNTASALDENGVRRGDGFLIPKDWQPSAEIEKNIKAEKFCSDDEFNWHVSAFRMYWLERGEVRKSWNDVFVWFTREYGLTR